MASWIYKGWHAIDTEFGRLYRDAVVEAEESPGELFEKVEAVAKEVEAIVEKKEKSAPSADATVTVAPEGTPPLKADTTDDEPTDEGEAK